MFRFVAREGFSRADFRIAHLVLQSGEQQVQFVSTGDQELAILIARALGKTLDEVFLVDEGGEPSGEPTPEEDA